MDPIFSIDLLFHISAKIGKNDMLLRDISNALQNDDMKCADVIASAIMKGAHISVIELLGTMIIPHKNIMACIYRCRIGGEYFSDPHISIYELVNMFYHNVRSSRAYYGAVAVALGFKIIKDYYVRRSISSNVYNRHYYICEHNIKRASYSYFNDTFYDITYNPVDNDA